MSLKEARTLVVKVGSSLVTNEGRGLDAGAIARSAEQVGGAAAPRQERHHRLERRHRRGHAAPGLGAAPARHARAPGGGRGGQMGLAQCYESSFRSHGLHSAQVC
jgi:glutamate 5-kinase